MVLTWIFYSRLSCRAAQDGLLWAEIVGHQRTFVQGLPDRDIHGYCTV